MGPIPGEHSEKGFEETKLGALDLAIDVLLAPYTGHQTFSPRSIPPGRRVVPLERGSLEVPGLGQQGGFPAGPSNQPTTAEEGATAFTVP